MIEHIWSVLCSRSIIDSETNSISLLDILEQLQIASAPIPDGGVINVTFNFELVSLWNRGRDNEPSRGRGRILVQNPSHTIIGQSEFEIDLSSHQGMRTRTKSPGLPVQQAGRHFFVIQFQGHSETEWREVAHIPLDILLMPIESQES